MPTRKQNGSPTLGGEGLDGIKKRADYTTVILVAFEIHACRIDIYQHGAKFVRLFESFFQIILNVENYNVFGAVVRVEELKPRVHQFLGIFSGQYYGHSVG